MTDSCQNRIEKEYDNFSARILSLVSDDYKEQKKEELQDEIEYLKETGEDYTELEEELSALDDAETLEDWENGVLSVDKTIMLDVLLSWGGPSDGIKVELMKDADGYHIENMWYYFKDWFDGARQRIPNSSETFAKLEAILEPWIDNEVYN